MSEPTKDLPPLDEAQGETSRDFVIFAVLILGTLLSVGSSLINLGAFNAVAVLFIALCQALLTLWFFMDVRYSSRVMKLAIVSGIFTLGVLFVMTMTDYISRAWGAW
jgi:cytochrome c oxidase subunit 4